MVMDDEFVALETGTQIVFKNQLPKGLGSSARDVELIVIAVQFFGPVQGSARTLQQRQSIFRVVRIETDRDVSL